MDITATVRDLHPTGLFGRDQDLTLVENVLGQADVRLLTLTGPGGVGKTRLAIAVVERVEDDYDDGAQVVDLAPLADSTLLPATIAAAFGLDLSSEDAQNALAASLADRQLLLVLDNCEHLRTAAMVVANLISRCPRLTVLATSRAPLGLSWEHRLAVQPLLVPGAGATLGVDVLAQVPAVALFVARATAADASFVLTPDTARDIARLVERLDGLPLAIELAAARSGLLSPGQILRRLDSHLPLLPVTAPDVPPRHQTLRAAMQWSYDQLTTAGQQLFCSVAVFAGKWTLESAEAVVGPTMPELDVLSELGSLVDLSLVQSDRTGDTPRFSLLQTVRQFALDQLAARSDLASLQSRHAAYFAALAEVDIEAMSSTARERWLNRLDAAHDNLRGALEWLLDHDWPTAGRLAVALGPFWWMKGYVAEGRRWLDRALEVIPSDDARIRAQLLWLAGELSLWQGQAVRGEELHREQLQLEERIGDARGIGLALANLGVAAIIRGEYERAQERLSEAQVYAGKSDDARLGALILRDQSWLAHLTGDQDTAARLHSEATDVFLRLGDVRHLAMMLTSYAEVERDRGKLAHANTLLRQALRLGGELRDRRTVGFAAQASATVVGGTIDPELLVHLLSASETFYKAAGMPWDPLHASEHAVLLEGVRERLGPRFDALWAAGRDLGLDDVIMIANSALDWSAEPERPADTGIDDDNPLSERERQVLTMVAEGLPSKRIARNLGIAERTVKAHLTTSFNKLGAYSRGHAALIARERGLIRVGEIPLEPHGS